MDYAIVPGWFFGYNILLEIIFATSALLVGIFSFRIYKISGQRQPKLFGAAFIFISVAYFMQSLLNFVIMHELAEPICVMKKVASVHEINLLGIYIHIFLFLAGLTTLFYMTLRRKNILLYLGILVILFLAVSFSTFETFTFYLIATLLLLYVSVYYLLNYLRKKQKKTLLISLAFLFLMFGRLHFLFSINHGNYYVAGHLLELVAYVLILFNLVAVFKRK